jgi:hypothetical protein
MGLKTKYFSGQLPRWLAVGVLASCGLQAQSAADTAKVCDATTLNAAFGYRLSGTAYDSQGYAYILGIVGRIIFDGAGNLTGMQTYNIDGYFINRQQQLTGSYAMSADCTGSVTVTPSSGSTMHFDFVAVSGGNEIELVQVDTGYSLTGTMKIQNPPVAATTPATTPTTTGLQKR